MATSASSPPRLLLIVAPHETDRRRLLQHAIHQMECVQKWLVRWIDAVPEQDLFAAPEIWVLRQAEQWEDPAPFLAMSLGVVVAAMAKCPPHSPWRQGSVVDLSSEKPWDRESRIARELVEMAAARGKKMTQELALSLVRRLGVEHPGIDQELEKVLLHLGDRAALRIEDLSAVTLLQHQDSGWALADALLRKQLGAALSMADHLLVAQDQPLPSITAQLRYVFEQALAVAHLPQEQVQKRFPNLKGKRLQALRMTAEAAGSSSLEQMLIGLAELEIATRQHGAVAEQYWALQRFILRSVSSCGP